MAKFRTVIIISLVTLGYIFLSDLAYQIIRLLQKHNPDDERFKEINCNAGFFDDPLKPLNVIIWFVSRCLQALSAPFTGYYLFRKSRLSK